MTTYSYLKEITPPPESQKRGMKNKYVKPIQEWLCLHGIYVAIDKDFGPATDRAVRQFQEKNGLVVDGIVGKNTFNKLTEHMQLAMKDIELDNKTIGEGIVLYAEQHLSQHLREVGGAEYGTLGTYVYEQS